MLNDYGVQATLTPEEFAFLSVALQKIPDGCEAKKNMISDRRGTDYLTVSVYIDYSFLRVHIGQSAKWFSIYPAESDMQNPLFDKLPENCKVQSFWKVYYSSLDDVLPFVDIIARAAERAVSDHRRQVELSEKIAAHREIEKQQGTEVSEIIKTNGKIVRLNNTERELVKTVFPYLQKRFTGHQIAAEFDSANNLVFKIGRFDVAAVKLRGKSFFLQVQFVQPRRYTIEGVADVSDHLQEIARCGNGILKRMSVYE